MRKRVFSFKFGLCQEETALFYSADGKITKQCFSTP